VIPIHQTHYLMLRRNLLYTAITRAERVCILVGTRSALAQAVRNGDLRLDDPVAKYVVELHIAPVRSFSPESSVSRCGRSPPVRKC